MTEPTTDDITAAEPAISAQEVLATVMANDAPVAEKDTRATEEIGPKEVESGSIAVYTPLRTLEIPTPISALAFGHASHLFVGAADGSLRVYDLSTYKVVKAVKGLGAEISSIVCVKRSGSELRDAWVGCGKEILKFQMDVPKLVLDRSDALLTLGVGAIDEDEVNELAINSNKSHLAFGLDSGNVGIVDLKDNAIKRMGKPHTSVCGTVKFIPDWPKEIVSGGYDTALQHYNFVDGHILTRREMAASGSVTGTELAPPFIMSSAISPTGVLAAGTADGHVWFGFGGERQPRKKSKKNPDFWKGLSDDHYVKLKVAEGPLVAMAFASTDRLTVATMMGVITQYTFIYDSTQGKLGYAPLWTQKTQKVERVNSLLADEKRIVVGGFDSKERGVVEIWNQSAKLETPGQHAQQPKSN